MANSNNQVWPHLLRRLIHRACEWWNSLPNSAVHAESTDIFKKPLHKFWSNLEIIYNYHAKIQGNRS